MKHQKPATTKSAAVAVSALLLLVGSLPVAASTGLSKCNVAKRVESFAVSLSDFEVHIVDHGVNHGADRSVDHGTTEPGPDDAADQPSPQRIAPSSSRDAKAAVLTELLEKTAAGESDAIPIPPATGAPLAEVVTPNAPENIDEDVNTEASSGPAVRGLSTRLPGLSEDASIRFRSQMYRTDI